MSNFLQFVKNYIQEFPQYGPLKSAMQNPTVKEAYKNRKEKRKIKEPKKKKDDCCPMVNLTVNCGQQGKSAAGSQLQALQPQANDPKDDYADDMDFTNNMYGNAKTPEIPLHNANNLRDGGADTFQEPEVDNPDETKPPVPHLPQDGKLNEEAEHLRTAERPEIKREPVKFSQMFPEYADLEHVHIEDLLSNYKSRNLENERTKDLEQKILNITSENDKLKASVGQKGVLKQLTDRYNAKTRKEDAERSAMLDEDMEQHRNIIGTYKLAEEALNQRYLRTNDSLTQALLAAEEETVNRKKAESDLQHEKDKLRAAQMEASDNKLASGLFATQQERVNALLQREIAQGEMIKKLNNEKESVSRAIQENEDSLRRLTDEHEYLRKLYEGLKLNFAQQQDRLDEQAKKHNAHVKSLNQSDQGKVDTILQLQNEKIEANEQLKQLKRQVDTEGTETTYDLAQAFARNEELVEKVEELKAELDYANIYKPTETVTEQSNPANNPHDVIPPGNTLRRAANFKKNETAGQRKSKKHGEEAEHQKNKRELTISSRRNVPTTITYETNTQTSAARKRAGLSKAGYNQYKGKDKNNEPKSKSIFSEGKPSHRMGLEDPVVLPVTQDDNDIRLGKQYYDNMVNGLETTSEQKELAARFINEHPYYGGPADIDEIRQSRPEALDSFRSSNDVTTMDESAALKILVSRNGIKYAKKAVLKQIAEKEGLKKAAENLTNDELRMLLARHYLEEEKKKKSKPI